MKFCENSTFFCIWIFYFRKNKIKVGFGYEKSSFSRDKYWNCGPKIFGGTIKTHEILRKQYFSAFFGYVSYIFPISDFFSKCPARKKIKGNFTKNKHKKQIFAGNCCENRTKIKHKKQNFWRKMLRKSYFLTKKQFLIFARFS